MNNIVDITLASLTLEEVNGYKDMYYRPYDIHINGQTMDNITTMSERCGLAGFTPANLASVAPDILKLGDTGGQVPIPNGWQTARLRFVLAVEVTYAASTKVIHYFQGFTDYNDPTRSGKLDPQMMFIVNGIHSVSRVVNDNRTFDRNRDNNQLLSKPLSAMGVGEVHSIRPNDVFVGVQLQELGRVNDYIGEDYSDPFTNGAMVSDKSTVIGSTPKLSKRLNQSPGSYLAELLNSYALGKSYVELDMTKTDVIGTAYNNTDEDQVYDNPFFQQLYQAVNEANVSGMFRYGDLLNLDPSIDQRATLVAGNGMQAHSEYHNINDLTTYLAASASHQIVALLHRTGLVGAMLTATNQTTSGEFKVNVAHLDAAGGGDLSANKSLLETYVAREVMPYLTNGNLIGLSIDVISNIYMDTAVTVRLEANPEVSYVFPSFADGVYSPVVSDSPISHIGSAVETLFTSMEISTPTVQPNGVQELGNQPLGVQDLGAKPIQLDDVGVQPLGGQPEDMPQPLVQPLQ